MKNNRNIYQILFNIFFVLVFPVVVLAPMGTWIPLAILAVITICSVKNFKSVKLEKKYLVFFVTFILVSLISIFLYSFDLKTFNRLLSLYFIMFLFLILLNLYEIDNIHKNIIIQLSISVIISFFIIIFDYFFQIGFKLWLSNNFDNENFSNFYSIKSWTSLIEFRANFRDTIIKYIGNTYDRGITALSVLAIPLIALCLFYKMKKTSILIFFLTIVSLISFVNVTALISFFVALLLMLFFIYVKFFKKKIMLIIIFPYCIFLPFTLSNFNYKNFSDFEIELESQSILLKKNILTEYPNFYSPKSLLDTEKNDIELGICCSFHSNAFYTFLYDEKKMPIIKYSFKHYFLIFKQKLLHRKSIWNFSKEKILERPIVGHGIFSSRVIGDEHKVINMYNK